MKKNYIFLFSFLTVATFSMSSCSGSGIRHTRSINNEVYSADLNHDGTIADWTDTEGTLHKEKNITWVQAYDQLLQQANSMKDLNAAVESFHIYDEDPYAIPLARYEILHQAEELVMSTGAVLPLCNYEDPYLLKPEISDIYTMNLGFKFMDQLTKYGKTGQEFTVTVGTKAETFDPAANSDASTALALYQCMVGAKRYVKGDNWEDDRKGIYKAELDDGVCIVKKLIVNDEETDPDEGWIKIDDCPDLMDYIDRKLAKKEDYLGTARYTIQVKPEAVWSNGEKIKIDDFIYAWKRASSAVYNKQPFGMWCQLFDSIRGYTVWNTIGQQTSSNPNDWKEETRKKWNNTDPKEGPVLTEEEKQQYKDVWEGATFSHGEHKYEYDKQGCSGGMIGVMKTGDDTMTVQLVNDCSYFDSLLAFTAFMPVYKKNVLPGDQDEINSICTESKDWWLNKGNKYVTNGTLMIKGEIDNTDGGNIQFEKCDNTLNAQWKDDASKIIKSLKFLFIDKDSTMYDTYRTGNAVLTNNFPISVIDKLKSSEDWHAPEQIGLYFYTFNVNDNTFDLKPEANPILGERNREKLRIAFNKLINRFDIGHNVYKKGKSADGYVPTGVEEYVPFLIDEPDHAGNKVYIAKREGESEDLEKEPIKQAWQKRNKDLFKEMGEGTYKNQLELRTEGGFYDIVKDDEKATEEEERAVMDQSTKEAIALAEEAGVKYNEKTGKFTNFPSVVISTNNGTAHEDVAERIQAYMGLWGIDVDVKTIEWQSFTAARRTGDYALARQGWIADYNDPRSFLDCARSTDGNDDTQLGKDSWHRSH